ncbi:linoleate diol synthase [Lactarius quietus]|nr:linoleate diol synthase [Lactarius quietus]
MTSRPSKFLSRASVGGVVSSAYDLLTTAGQTINPIKSSSTTQSYNNEAAVKDFENAFKKSLASYHEPNAVAAAINAFKHINSLDDRKMGVSLAEINLEHVVYFLSQHADGILKDKVAEFESKLVEILYDDLSHPPATYIGPEYQYRRADGAYNNICDPEMGKACMPYARSVQQTHPILRNTLPDAGLVFDTLLRRQKAPRRAVQYDVLVRRARHSYVFRTSHDNVNINETSSYVDLAPLYGNNEQRLNEIRVHDGRGLMLPDTFAEDRLMLLPPAVCVLLVLFGRNHNYIANKLLEINERQTYTKPENISLDDPDRAKKISDQDEDIFQTARLINCAWFGAAIFRTTSVVFSALSPRQHVEFEPLRGNTRLGSQAFRTWPWNVCSVEFNCLYRWHATTSQHNEEWVTTLMGSIFKDKPIDDLTVDDFKDAIKKIQAQEPDISHWTFGGLQRGADGKFDDTQLAGIIKDAVKDPAASFGARGTPHIMRLHEIMGIEANRRWGVCTLNEFRKFLGLKPYTTFLEWNSDKEIAEAAEHLYSNIDSLELYVGLQAEEAKKPVEGAGLCPGYTISRAILSDAIALTRGDRFLTADFTPFNSRLGASRTVSVTRKDLATEACSVVSSFTPESMEVFLRKLGKVDLYNFNRPPDPAPIGIAKEYNDVQQILGSAQFRHPYGDKGARIVSGEGFFLASNKEAENQRDQREVLRIMGAPDETDHVANYFYEKTRELIHVKSYSLTDKSIKFVDIVRDVLRYVPLHWAASELAGLTLKANNDAFGDYTEPELYGMITDIYSFLFLDLDPSKSMNIEASAKEHIKTLQGRIKANILADVGGKLSIAGLVGSIQSLFSAKARKSKLTVAESLYENGASAERTTNNVLSLLVGASVELSQSIINVVDFYLDKPDVVKQLKAADPKNHALGGYIYEAMRIDPPFRGVYRESVVDQTVGNLTFSKGQRVFVNLAHASHDPNVFPDPRSVNVKREPRDRYLTGDGVTRSLGVELSTKIMSQVLRAVFEFSGVRRTPGLAGHLKRYKVTAENTLRYEYLDIGYLPTAWPNSMVLQFDAPPRVNGA